MSKEDPMIEAAKLGMEAEVFRSSPLGRFLIKKAEDEESDAIEHLIAADPENAKEQREYRNQIHVSRMFIEWLNDAVEIGRAAVEMLRQQEDEG